MDKFVESITRTVAQRTSRRSFLARLGKLILGAAAATSMASLRPRPDPSCAPRKGFLARPSKTVIGRNLRLAAARCGNLPVNKL